MTSYYQRTGIIGPDGGLEFTSPEDEAHEREVANQIEAAWSCHLRPFGRLSPLDWYAERHGRLVGVLELKSRSHASTTYPTVYLNVRKWLALQLAAIGLGVPALFVVRFTDTVKWTRIGMPETSTATIGGCLRLVKSRSDIEPIIEVPVTDLRGLTATEEL